MKKIKNADGVAVLAYIRYILPPILLAALLLSLFIPCLKFTVVSSEGVTGGEMSVAMLLENSWETVRSYLFGGGELEGGQEAFSQAVLILIPLMWILYGVGFLSSLAAAVGAVAYLRDEGFKKTDAGIWFITILPNRIVVCALHVLVLPLLLYHRILVLLYDKLMNIDVTLDIIGVEPWVLGLIVLVAVFALSAVSAYLEKDCGLDVFKKPIPPVVRVIDRDDSEEPSRGEKRDDVYEEQKRRAREEQADYIRKLLNKNDEENK